MWPLLRCCLLCNACFVACCCCMTADQGVEVFRAPGSGGAQAGGDGGGRLRLQCSLLPSPFPPFTVCAHSRLEVFRWLLCCLCCLLCSACFAACCCCTGMTAGQDTTSNAIALDVVSRRRLCLAFPHPAAHGLLALIRLLRASLLHVIKRNQA